MLRNDIQRITGLTRKALEYYEEKGFIHPRRLENGYREYSEKDVEILNKIALFKKIRAKHNRNKGLSEVRWGYCI